MGGAIGFAHDPDRIWLKAGWVYDRFLSDVQTRHADDDVFIQEIEQAMIFQSLGLDSICAADRALAQKIVRAMKDVGRATLGEIELPNLRWKEGLDEEGQRMYCRAIRELLELIDRELASDAPWGKGHGGDSS